MARDQKVLKLLVEVQGAWGLLELMGEVDHEVPILWVEVRLVLVLVVELAQRVRPV